MPKRLKKKGFVEDEPVNYWRSSADLLMGLLLLLFLLLILFMYRSNDVDDDQEETIVEVTDQDEQQDEQDDADEEIIETHDGDDSEDVQVSDDDDNDDNDYDGYDDITATGTIRAAVKIISKDYDTGEQIQQENLHFQLRDSGNRVLKLSSYYPSVMHYDSFATMKDGTLYLPERIRDGSYVITSMDAPDGYRRADAETFVIDEDYEWDKPYEVTMYFAILRNKIFIRVVDTKEQTPVKRTAVDIITTRDTVNPEDGETYAAGRVISSMVTNAEGTAESSELPLGEYILEVSSLPEEYAYPLENTEFTLTEQDEENEVCLMELSKTQVVISVADELTQKPLEGITLSVTDGKSEQEFQTDEEGKVLLTGLNKGTNYTVIQKNAAEYYQIPTEKVQFSVNNKGWVNNQITTEYSITDRMIQVSFSANSLLLKRPLVNQNAVLTNSSDRIVAQWTTGDHEWLIKGLDPGDYTYKVGSKSIAVKVADIASVQSIELQVISTQEWIIICGCALFVLALITGLVIVWLRRRKRNRQQ